MQVKDVIVCDDIRTEISNKFTLVGIYFDKIRVNSTDGGQIKLPLNMKSALMIRLTLLESDIFPQDFAIRYHINNETIARIEGNVTVEPNNKSLNLPIMVPIQVKSFGVLDFDLEFSKDGKTTYSFKNIHPIQIEDAAQLSFGIDAEK